MTCLHWETLYRDTAKFIRPREVSDRALPGEDLAGQHASSLQQWWEREEGQEQPLALVVRMVTEKLLHRVNRLVRGQFRGIIRFRLAVLLLQGFNVGPELAILQRHV